MLYLVVKSDEFAFRSAAPGVVPSNLRVLSHRLPVGTSLLDRVPVVLSFTSWATSWIRR